MEVVIERGVPLPRNITMVLPEDMREELKVPLGPVLQSDEIVPRLQTQGSLCTVGDMTTETVHRMGLPIKLAVVDYKTKRRPDGRWMEALAPVGERTLVVANPAATITWEM
ncbi:MAG: DUF359 domain-containing protein, partial [Thermoplasmata archaeon]|nr:DUF359 domain-containing protein [Thermoplasmata archaeon]